MRGEFEKYWSKIERGENFALARYADGERALMTGMAIKAVDGWESGNEISSLGKALSDSLGFIHKNFVYGISCPCCDSAAYYWYMERLKGCNVTFSNIWANSNFAKFWEKFQNLEREAVLITNYRGKGKTFGKLKVKAHYFTTTDDSIKFFEQDCENLIQKIISEVGAEKNLLFAVSAGPMSEIFIKALFENNPENCYIDFGSALDQFTHEKITRPYMIESTAYAQQHCWMFDNKKVSFDVDVVLSAYRRTEVLPQQLAAIKNQTLKPRKIFLYQDAVKSGEKIVIPQEILNQFDDYKIAETNGGVWKRFEYAAEISDAEYVCVFDDDTIPGERWLENCHMNMQAFGEGIFGTNGVIIENPAVYPKSIVHVGWHTSNEQTFEVDFVGHSWFIKPEYLKWMLEKPYAKDFKYCAEDMAISFAAQEHGVQTFVPAHPQNILSLWGSIPKFGFEYGNNAVALWLGENSQTMKQALKIIHDDGWQYLLERNVYYVEYIRRLQKDKILSARLNTLTVAANLFYRFFGKKQPIFIGERIYQQKFQDLFNSKDYLVLESEDGRIYLDRLLKKMKKNKLNIFFTGIYEKIKPALIANGFRENENFVDGTILLK